MYAEVVIPILVALRLFALGVMSNKSANNSKERSIHEMNPVHRDDTRCIYDIVIPGSHDSGAYVVSYKEYPRRCPAALQNRVLAWFLHPVVDVFTRTQLVDVYGQLKRGCRFLDLRVSKLEKPAAGPDKNASPFWLVHGMAACCPFDGVIDQINRFHKEASTEATLNGSVQRLAVEIKAISGGYAGMPDAPSYAQVPTIISVIRPFNLSKEDIQELVDYLKSRLHYDIFDGSTSDLRKIPYNLLPPNLIVGVHGLGQIPKSQWATDDWIDTYSPQVKVSGLAAQVQAKKHRQERDDLYVVGFTITPQATDFAVKCATVWLYPRKLTSKAKSFNEKHLESFMKENRQAIIERANVIFFDSFTEQQAVIIREFNETVAQETKT